MYSAAFLSLLTHFLHERVCVYASDQEIPLEVVWCEVCRVVYGYVVRREATALTNRVSHEEEIHPDGGKKK